METSVFSGFSSIMFHFLNKIDVNIRWILSYLTKMSFGQKPRTLKDLEVIYSSRNFLIINKQWDIAINTDRPKEHPVTVATQLNHKFPHLADPSVMHGFRFCHQLDYSTSGVLCLALTKNAARHSTIILQSRKAEKYYLALVHGHITEENLVIQKGIGTDTRPEFSHCMCTSEKEYCSNSRWAATKLLVLQRGLYNNHPATKVLMKLLTGRRHQLRVHCYELGYTIIGDYTYSKRKDLGPYRMFLHAFRFVLPTEIEAIDVSTEDPFTEDDARNKWIPKETVNLLNEEAFVKITNFKPLPV